MQLLSYIVLFKIKFTSSYSLFSNLLLTRMFQITSVPVAQLKCVLIYEN